MLTRPQNMTGTLALLALLTLLISPVLAHEDHQASTFEVVVENYLGIQTALAGDSLGGVADGAALIAKSSASLRADFDAHQAGVADGSADQIVKLLPALEKAAVSLTKAGSLKKARAAFGDLSEVIVEYRNLVEGDVPNVAYCPMAKKSWLQNGKTIANPYYGSSMLRCGSIVKD